MLHRLVWLGVPLAVILTGCLSHPMRPAPRPIDSTVHLELAETLPSAQGTLRLRLRTEREYGCSNVALATSLARAPGSFQLTLLGVRNPGVCLTGLGPATAEVDLGHLTAGEYTLRFILNGAAIESRLLVTADAYRIVGGNTASFTIDHSTLRRVPERMAWGWIGYADAAGQAAAKDFLDGLRAAGAEAHVFASGRYAPVIQPGVNEVFHIDARGRLVLGGTLGFVHLEPYVFRYAGDDEVLRGLVRATGEQHPGAVYVLLDTGNGIQLMSWTLAGSTRARRASDRS